MASKKNRYDTQNYNYGNDLGISLGISDEALIASRRQEMEEFILPNHQTILELSNGRTVIIKSKEVKLWEE